ncbi:MAG: hypothetical protein K8I30_23680, partial [Anaerolineae bacterium]|nr:hypothetical protein [Anaerolineae bacterium]
RAFDTTQPAVAGTRVRVPLNTNAAPSGPPTPPEPYDGQRLLPLPLGYLDRSLSLLPALTQEQIDALLRDFPVFQETLTDSEDDVLTCDTRVSAADPEVDIDRIVVGRTSGGDFVAQVHLRAPLVTDYSFAVILNLIYPGGVRRYIWEVHDEVNRIGEIVPDTGVVIAGMQAVVEQAGNVVSFFIPRDELPETITQVGVRSFHTPDREMQPQPKHCDTFGLVDFPERLR